MVYPIFIFLFIFFNPAYISGSNSKWHYECNQGYCVKKEISANSTEYLSLAECNILCLDSAALWPKPTGSVLLQNPTPIDLDKFFLQTPTNTVITDMVYEAFFIFISETKRKMPCKTFLQPKSASLSSIYLDIFITDTHSNILTFGTDEGYNLSITQNKEAFVNVSIKSQTFFGARHALETLGQLIVYDDLRNRILLPNNAIIIDEPIFFWRGISLDTSRNYISTNVIKRTLRAMAASKLNTFHWHLTDTASFPYVSKSRPELSEYGAYSQKKVYDDATIKDIIQYARVRGIRVVPEFDAPAHVGEGWQNTEVVTCFNWHPWQDYCVQPPCGQFDPSRADLYNILEDLYGDMLDQFGTEVFHMGGDEVHVGCWNSTEHLTNWMINEKGWNITVSNFYEKVWPYFQKEAVKRLYKRAGKEVPVILWSSDLTALDDVTDILPPSKYVIQVWTMANDSSIQTLLEKNYSIILSNFDALYLDCGFSAWVAEGNNWCSPYKGWQTVYENKPVNIAGNRTNQVLGGETALWTEQAGSGSIDSRLWPRAAAFAETLWTNPSSNWTDAEERMLLHRERLINIGINADMLEPEWCLRNQQNCPVNGKFNN